MPKGQPFTRICQALVASNNFFRADLHVHSSFSDGLVDCSAIFKLATHLGLKAISITDHDTLAGHQTAISQDGIEVIPGVEVTCLLKENTIHLLGYFVDPFNNFLQEGLEENRKVRFQILNQRGDFLVSKGMLPSNWKTLVSPLLNHKGFSVGSRHLARILVNQGKAQNINQAIWKYWKEFPPQIGKWLSFSEAIKLIRKAGGIPVLAHPRPELTESSIKEMGAMGLGGIEIFYPGIKKGRRAELKSIASRLGLVETGGSDWHGDSGRALGTETVPFDCLEKLREVARETLCSADCLKN